MRQVVLEYGDDGWWTVRCPSLPGCNSQGKTQEEALGNIKEAIELYLEVLIEDGKPIPPENFSTVTTAVAVGT